MKIVYMGTPDFAVPCLQRLVDLGHEVGGVFCQPDKPQGRKMVFTPPPVKVLAEECGLPVYQPGTLRNGEALEIIKGINPELIVVVAYGKILPKEILDFPKYGCINIHASLLPVLRGAAPIQWSVINGLEETGITSMYMDVGLDTGDILCTAKVKIGENETSEQLWDRLSLLAPDVLEETLAKLKAGTLERIKQDDSLSTYAPLLSKELSPVDWSKTASEVHNLIRGLYSWPCATAVIGGKKAKLISSRIVSGFNGKAGEVLESGKALVIACGEGAVEIITLQPEGKKAMSAPDFLRGTPIEKGTILQEA